MGSRNDLVAGGGGAVGSGSKAEEHRDERMQPRLFFLDAPCPGFRVVESLSDNSARKNVGSGDFGSEESPLPRIHQVPLNNVLALGFQQPLI